MLTAYKFRLYPNKEQKILFSKYFGCNRVVWNKALELREKYYKEHKNDEEKRGLNYYDTARFLTGLKKEEEYKWLKEANAQSLQQTLMDLDKAFKSFFKGISDYPNYKKKVNKQAFRVPQFFRFDDDVLYLPKFGKGIKMVEHREFTRENVRQLTVSKNPSGEYFVSILVEDEMSAGGSFRKGYGWTFDERLIVKASGFHIKRTNCFGAVSPLTGDIIQSSSVSAKTPAFIRFLDKLVDKHAGKKIILFMDNFRVHVSGKVKRFLKRHPNIMVRSIPPYSPWLNPQEYWWGYLRRKPLNNRFFRSSR